MSSEHAIREAADEIQVDATHYEGISYNSSRRVASYEHQLRETLRYSPQTVIEVGGGGGAVRDELRRQGIDVFVIDIDASLKPDLVASVTDLPDTVEPADVVLCCQVLEHLPLEAFDTCVKRLSELARGALVISLPDRRRYIRVTADGGGWGLLRPRILPIPRMRPPHILCGEHCWEIGAEGSVSITSNNGSNRRPAVGSVPIGFLITRVTLFLLLISLWFSL